MKRCRWVAWVGRKRGISKGMAMSPSQGLPDKALEHGYNTRNNSGKYHDVWCRKTRYVHRPSTPSVRISQRQSSQTQPPLSP